MLAYLRIPARLKALRAQIDALTDSPGTPDPLQRNLAECGAGTDLLLPFLDGDKARLI